MANCLVGLGSNAPTRSGLEPLKILQAATTRLGLDCGDVLRTSSWLTTRPAGGPTGQAEFVNGVLLLDSQLAPDRLLIRLQKIEVDLERARDMRWGPRTLDLDLLLYDELVIETPTLVLPHPRMSFRRFVLAPAAEIAAEMVHPTTGLTIRELHDRLVPPWRIAVVGPQAERVAQSATAMLDELPHVGKACVRADEVAGILQRLPAPHVILSLESEPRLVDHRVLPVPMLRLPAADADVAVREVVAAVQAMEYLPK